MKGPVRNKFIQITALLLSASLLSNPVTAATAFSPPASTPVATSSNASFAASSATSHATPADAAIGAEERYDEDGFLLDGPVADDASPSDAFSADYVREDMPPILQETPLQSRLQTLPDLLTTIRPEADAEELEEDFLYINPVYEDLIDESEAQRLLEEEAENAGADAANRPQNLLDAKLQAAALSASQAADSESCTSREQAAEQVREFMKKRAASFDIDFSLYDIGTLREEMTAILLLAMEHTGDPVEGDYIAFQYLTAGGSGSATKTEMEEGTLYEGTFHFKLKYFTDAEQETQADAAAEALLSELDLEGRSDYEKLRRIYAWICEHVSYDHTHGDTYYLKHSAYAALVNRTAVCQGYATLLYRLSLASGVDCRLISGEASGVAHGWNIVRLDGLYYNVDSTWDAGHTDWSSFLKCDESFSGHTRDSQYESASFREIYPMAETDYVPAAPILTLTAEPGGTIRPSGSVAVEYGGNLTITLIPDTGYSLAELRIDEMAVSLDSGSQGAVVSNADFVVTSAPTSDSETAASSTSDLEKAESAVSALKTTASSESYFGISPAERGEIRYELQDITEDHQIRAIFAPDSTSSGFVQMLYREVLGRTADAAGLAYWSGMSGTLSGAETTAAGILGSAESRRLRNQDDRLQDILGALRFDAASSEADFRALCAEFGIVEGITGYINGEAAGNRFRFTDRQYLELLGRNPDPAGFFYWSSGAGVGSVTENTGSGITWRRNLLLSFIVSSEFIALDLNDTEFLHRLYRAALKRDPDPAGHAFWAGSLEKTGDRLGVTRAVLNSVEFRAVNDF